MWIWAIGDVGIGELKSNLMAQMVYGIHPVQEALKSPHFQFEEILVGTSKPSSKAPGSH